MLETGHMTLRSTYHSRVHLSCRRSHHVSHIAAACQCTVHCYTGTHTDHTGQLGELKHHKHVVTSHHSYCSPMYAEQGIHFK